MIDRIFSIFALVIAGAYGFLAFTVIKAPFQYDPLGPESWPQILSVVAVLCCLAVIWKPDVAKLALANKTLLRIGIVLVLLSAYSALYEGLGFIVSTILFCAIFASILGAEWKKALLFSLVTGIAGYFLCAKLLELNLPSGLLDAFL